jgi:hypothetical protein
MVGQDLCDYDWPSRRVLNGYAPRAFNSDCSVRYPNWRLGVDLQSLHSEDAITWSVFGTASRASQAVLHAWLADLLQLLDLTDVSPEHPEIALWRRVPHPDGLAPGGPEIDVTISTRNSLILCEAKWRSRVGVRQGKDKNKDQIQLRGEFLKDFAPRLCPSRTQFAVVGISLYPNAFDDTTPPGIHFRATTWEDVCALTTHPLGQEVARYFDWKKSHTKS